MGIEDIKKRILEDAAKQKEEILAEARKKAEEIRKEGERTAGKRKEVIILKAEQEATEEHHTLLTMERLEARKLQLTEKQKVIEKVFEKALDMLSNHPQYDEIMEALLLEVARGGEELILNPRDYKNLGDGFLKRINDNLPRELVLSKETRDMAGGFILRTPEVEINESFEEIVRALRDEMETQVARILFAG
ncbi:MAG: V-type ATP synthase subunit E family protein [Candidatus Methanofastidiosia archaeon]